MAVNQLKAGAVLNYAVLGINNILGLLYMPYMLRMMGQSEYGLYSLVASVIAYLTIMDFGFGNAIIRYTAKFRAEGKLQEQYSMFGMFLLLYIGIGVVAFIAGLGLYFNVETLFGNTMTSYELGRAKILLLIMVFNLAVTFPMSIFGSIITAYEDFVFQKVVQIVRILLNTAVMICLLELGYKAIAMVVVQTLFNLATLFINYFYCKYKIKIKLIFGKFKWGFLKEVAVYSFWIFLNAIMDRIYWSTGQFVLGAVAGTAAVAVFAVAVQLEHMYTSFSTAISGVFLPRITALVTKQKSDKEISDLFIKTGRIQYIIISFILCAFIVFGRQFIRLWAGEGYEDTYAISLMFFIATFVALIQNLGITILMARNEMKFRSLLYVIVAVSSLALSIPAAMFWGGIGCAAATSFAIVIQHIIMNVYYQRRQRINILHFWREIVKMSVAPAILCLAGLLLLQTIDIDMLRPGNFIIAAAIFTIAYLPCAWFLSMNRYERNLFAEPMNRVLLAVGLKRK